MSVREDGTSIIQARVADKRLARFKEIAEPRMQDDVGKALPRRFLGEEIIPNRASSGSPGEVSPRRVCLQHLL